MSALKKVSLVNLGSGAAVEKFDIELDKLADNLLDPNADPSAKRSIVLTVTVVPKAGRDFGDITIDCKSKLASPMAYEGGQLYYGLGSHGEVQVAAIDPRQGEMFPEKDLPENVTSINSGKDEAQS